MRTTEKINTTGASSLRFLYNTAVGRLLLKPIICKPVSLFFGFVLDRKISACFINKFIKSNNIDMSDYECKKYRSFNDFFTRKIKPETRPIDNNHNTLVSPCDARLTVYEINDESVFTIKGVQYTVSELLQDEKLGKEYNNGYCLIFRLAVDNYHRYGFCVDGVAGTPIHIKGKYHTVQPIAMRKFPIFRENVREYTVIDSELFDKVIQMEVGALNVGRICNYKTDNCTVKKGAEKGKFEFGGSTIIVLIKKDIIKLDEELLENTNNMLETNVKYGEALGTRI